jgi:Zn-dependent protease
MIETLVSVVILLVSVVLHEVAHAWQARREGDDTAERLGRITLNPIPHLDPIGSVVVPLVLATTGGFLFGWAKPVPVNRSNIRTGAMGDIRVSLAGIVVNLGLAVFFAVLLVPLERLVDPGSGMGGWLLFIASFGVLINLILAFFNLLPIPPLDGSHVLYYVLPKPLRAPYQALAPFGIFIVLLLFWFVPGAFDVVTVPVYFVRDILFSVLGLNEVF